MSKYFFTSESVSEGHPDKLCDQVSDAILDACLEQDPNSRVACETLAKTGFVVLAGEITSNAKVNFTDIARKTIIDIGYDSSVKGFDGHTCGVLTAIDKQSADIAMGVDETSNHEQGAGDQGIMFGYAVNETESFMPLSIDLSHKILLELARVRKADPNSWIYPDSKSQVTLEYINGKAARIDSIVVSTQHSAKKELKDIQSYVVEQIIPKTVPAHLVDSNTKYYINPTGRFVIGGPQGDCGLTGRKIIVDTYGGHGAHGGGAFSGKDPTKVDRSAAYMARFIAKHIVAAGLMDRCLVQLSYAIGKAEPLNVFIEDYRTSKVDVNKLGTLVREIFPLKPAEIIRKLNLKKPMYRKTASYGHFGRNDFPWENLEYVEKLKKQF